VLVVSCLSDQISSVQIHPLQVGRAFRRAKQLGVVIQRVEDFDGPHASPGEETGIGSKKILAASYVKVGAVGPGNGLGHCGDWREQDCKESGGGNSWLGHLVPRFSNCWSRKMIQMSH